MSEYPETEFLRDAMEKDNLTRYQWIRFLLSLASGTLALLVSLQGNYRPTSPLTVWLLRAGWLCLSSSILCGAAALHGEVRLADLVKRYQAKRITKILRGEDPGEEEFVLLPKIYETSLGAFYLFLLSSVIILTAFAVCNV